jgi:hypothetical protein
MYYPVILLGNLWHRVTGEYVPDFVIGTLLLLSVLVCVPSLLYRSVYDGKEFIRKPIAYADFAARLELFAFFGFASALVLTWYGLSHLFGCVWVIVYMVAEIVIGGIADNRRKRIWNTKLAYAQSEWADGSPRDQASLARMQFEDVMNEETDDEAFDIWATRCHAAAKDVRDTKKY